jgi:hypothetical protein
MSENLVNPSVPVKLDGQDYVLRYRAMAFIRYASECQGDLLHDIRRMGAALNDYGQLIQAGEFAALAPILQTMTNILWAGLIDAQPMIERDDVTRMFGLSDFPVLMPLITQAVVQALPSAGSVNPQKPAKPAKVRDSRSINGGASGLASETQAASASPNSAG